MSLLNDDNYTWTLEEQLLVARSVARRVARSWPPVEPDDIEQVVMLWAWSYQERITGWSEALLRTKFAEEAVGYARKERQARLHESDWYFYRPADVRAALPYFFSREDRDGVPVPEDSALVDAQHNDGCDDLVMLADIGRVFSSLAPDKQADLFWRWLHGPGDATERRREGRAVDALTHLLNGGVRSQLVGPGSRKAVSNATAIAMTRREDA